MTLLESLDQPLFLRMHLQFGMHRGHDEDVRLHLAQLRRLIAHRHRGEEENDRVDGDQGQRNYWPAAGRHVFMFDRN